jgi:hypothetical protein
LADSSWCDVDCTVIDPDGKHIVYHDFANISVAVATPKVCAGNVYSSAGPLGLDSNLDTNSGWSTDISV